MNYLKLKLKKTYVFRSFFLLFMLTQAFVSYAQSIVSGIIKGEKNEPIPGATVRVSGTKLSAITDAKGNFKLGVDNSIL